MNHFEVTGTVEEVEEQHTTKGNLFWLTTVDTGDEKLTVALFGGLVRRPPQAGETISIGGRLRMWKGFLQVKPEVVRLGEETRELAPVGEGGK